VTDEPRQQHDRSTQRSTDFLIGAFLLGDSMNDYPSNYSMRPGSAHFEDREELTRDLMERRRRRRRWRDDDDDDGDAMAQALYEAERKCTDAQLCGVPEPETHECANCGRVGDDSQVIELKRACGTGYGEWYCMPGQGCQE